MKLFIVQYEFANRINQMEVNAVNKKGALDYFKEKAKPLLWKYCKLISIELK